MTAFPQWDAKVEWGPPLVFAVDRGTGREAYYGPLAEPGTPDPVAAVGAWGQAGYAGWTQPDGRVVYYPPAEGWLEAFLAAIDAPLSLVNSEALQLWANSEGMPAASFNPLATLRQGYGEHWEPPFSAPFYPTLFAGQRAWVDTLTDGARGFTQIMQAFRLQLGLTGIWDAVNQSEWCGGCQGGQYPNQLYQQIHAATGAPPASAGPPGSAGTAPPPAPGPGESGPISGVGVTGVAPTEIQQGYQQLLDVVTETIPAATQALDTISHTIIGR